jgi:CheY-like chemotaxis protein
LRPGQGAPRILIVDDKWSNRDWLNQLLSKVGFSVREAHSGETSIRIWEQWKPDLILMDIRMPVMSGTEAAKQIRARPDGNKTAIIALSASVLDRDREDVLEGRFDGFLAKPCKETDLFDEIGKHLRVDYVYAGEAIDRKPESPAAQPSISTGEILSRLPAEVIGQLQQAILNGEKQRLDELIATIREHDTRFACTLQDLADRYEYDALTHLFEQAVR